MVHELTAEQFAARGARLEDLVDGQVVPLSPATLGHGRVASRLDWALREHVGRTGAGEVFTGEAGFITRRSPDRVRAPDVSFVSAARLAGVDLNRFFEGAPDLAVEVLSPSERPEQVSAKVEEYLAAGGRLVWVVDPSSATVIVHRRSLPPLVLGMSDVVDGADVLAGFRMPVSQILGQ